jgi:type IV secretion system protein VirB11
MSYNTLKQNTVCFRPFLQDSGVTDIVVNRPGEIGVEKNSRWSWYDEPWLTYERMLAIAYVAAFDTNQNISSWQPIATPTMPDGERLHICLPPATLRGIISFTIRRPPGFRPTIERLHEMGMFEDIDNPSGETAKADPLVNAWQHDQFYQRLLQAVLAKKNILICGATGSGKTTLARALIAAIPDYERIVTIEDTAEWHDLPQRNRVALFYSKGQQGGNQITSVQLMESSLRMKPDRVLMGELRDDASFTYLRSVVAGHPGGITTLHANTAKDAFNALRLMVRGDKAGQSMQDADIKEMLMSHVGLVAHCHHDKEHNTYRVTDVYEPGILAA